MKPPAVFNEELMTADFPDGQIIVAPLDTDKTGDASEDVAAGVSRSFQRLRLRDQKQGAGSSWKSGGGGVGEVKNCIGKDGTRAIYTCHNVSL